MKKKQCLHMANRKATAVANGAFLLAFGLVILVNQWWPWVLVPLWINIFLRQYLTHRLFDAAVSTVLFWGFIALTFVPTARAYVIPVLFFTGGIYLIVREYFFSKDTNGEESSEAIEDDSEVDLFDRQDLK